MFSKSCLLKLGCILACALMLLHRNVMLAQQPPAEALSKILERLDQLEKQNKELISEIQALRADLQKENALAASDAQDVEEKVEVAQQRIDEQAQTKVEASQRFPISLTGMFLFDSFLTHGPRSQAFQDRYEDYSLGAPGGGANLNQSIIGLNFHGPQIPGDGRINGYLAMDFYGYAGSDSLFRIRRGVVSFDWKNRSIIVGQDKSIIAPFEPTSFARVAIPPLSGSGNLWLWRPQVTYEERLPISESNKLTFRASVFETDERNTAPSLAGTSSLDPSRPAAQGRVQWQHKFSNSSIIAFGLAGDASTTHVLGRSVPSRVISADFLIKPRTWLEITGTLLHGKNFANLGGIPAGVTITSDGNVIPIRGNAGWLQAAFPVTKRLTFDVYTGRQVNNSDDLSPFEVFKNDTFAANVLYRIAPNVVLGFEGARNQLDYLNGLMFRTNRYDATVAYLF